MQFINLDKNSPTISKEFWEEYNKVVGKIINAERVLERKLKIIISGAPAKVKIDIKDPGVALEKFLREDKTYKKITDMPDLLRAKIICPMNMPLEHFKNRVEKVFKNTSSEWIDNPSSGYSGVWHIDTNIDGLRVEIQIVPRGLDPYSKVQHETVYAPKRKGEHVDPKVENSSKRLLMERLPAYQKALRNRLINYKMKKKSPDDLDSIAQQFYLLCKYAELLLSKN